MSKNPAYFKRSYRLDRVDFMDLLSNIRPCIEYNELTNAVISVSLLIHSFSLRMLAGGSYLDICFGCRISTSHIYQIFWRVLEVMCWVSVCVCVECDEREAAEWSEATPPRIWTEALYEPSRAGRSVRLWSRTTSSTLSEFLKLDCVCVCPSVLSKQFFEDLNGFPNHFRNHFLF